VTKQLKNPRERQQHGRKPLMIRSDQKPDAPIEAQSAMPSLAPGRELASQLLISPDAIDPAFVGDPIHSLAPKTSARSEAASKKGHSCKSLRTQFRHDGFDFRKIYRKGDFAIYRQTWKGNVHSAAFEVICIRHREGFQIHGRFVEPAEVYPNSEAWGVDGWTLTNKDAAFAKLRELATSLNTPARFGQKKKRSRLEKSPT
jgi:hypothetical protein